MILSIFGSSYKPDIKLERKESESFKSEYIVKNKSTKIRSRGGKISGSSSKNGSSSKSSSKKRGYQRKIQSEISLSTISEEPHSEEPTPIQDLRFDLSIRCY